MRRLALPGRDRRVLLAGIGAVASILVLGRGVPFIRALYAAERAGALEQRAALSATSRAVARIAQLSDSARAREAALEEWRARVFPAASLNAAAAAAVSQFGGVARRHQVELGSVQVQRDTVLRAGFATITLSAALTADVRGLAHMLAELEAGPNLWRLHSLSVSQPDVAGRGDPGAPEALSVQLVVRTLALVKAP